MECIDEKDKDGSDCFEEDDEGGNIICMGFVI